MHHTGASSNNSRKSTYDRDMIEVGLDINIGGLSRQKLSEKRLKKGECPTCGFRLFKVGILGKKKAPLNIVGRVQEGRCLTCHPLESLESPTKRTHVNAHATTGTFGMEPTPAAQAAQASHAAHVADIPHYIQQRLHYPRDDATIISGITTFDDADVISDTDSEGPTQRRPHLRPHASLGDCGSPDDRPTMPKRSPSNKPRPKVGLDQYGSDRIPIPGPLPIPAQKKESPRRPTRSPALREHPEEQRFSLSDSEEEAKTEIEAPERLFSPPWIGNEAEEMFPSGGSDPKEIFFDSSERNDLVGRSQVENDRGYGGLPKADIYRYKENIVDPNLTYSDDDEDKKPAAQQWTQRKSRVMPETEQAIDNELKRGTSLRTKSWLLREYHEITTMPEQELESIPEPVSRGAEIPSLLRRLEIYGIKRDARSSVLNDLILILWTSGVSGKATFVECHGIEKITKLMWADISDSTTQELVVQLLLALTASFDADPVNDVTGERLDTMIDALMITMQVLIENEVIQEFGCRILGCLASASSTSPGVNDGTLCGAVQTVVNALDAHPHSQSIQECGLQALFNQCVYSKNSDINKLALVQGESTGILRALRNENFESSVAEWACKLYWSLSQDIVAMIPSAEEVLEEMLLLMRGLSQNTDYVELLRAAVGTIANLVKVEHHQENIDATESVMLAIDLICFQYEDACIVIECCCWIGNLAVLSPNMEAVTKAGGVQRIVDAILRFPDDEILYEEGMRALCCLSIHSEAAKTALCEPRGLATAIKLCRGHKTPAPGHEMVCTLLSSIFASEESSHGDDLVADGIDSVCFAMRAHPQSLQVQEAGSFALRNISHRSDGAIYLQEKYDLSPLISAMLRFENERAIQMNGCSILNNIVLRGDRENAVFDDLECIECIVKAMQNHLEAAEVLEMACGALWSLIYESNTRKERLLRAGGVDAILCSLVMHQDSSPLLENAGGVLLSLSAIASSSEAIASKQGIGIMVDTMRNNGSSINVLRTGTLFLRNMVLVYSGCLTEAEDAITSVINGMQETTDEGFQAEACNFLWAISALSDDGKAKILALDGITVLIHTLEQYGEAPLVQDAALGAFNQLALTSSD